MWFPKLRPEYLLVHCNAQTFIENMKIQKNVVEGAI